VCARAKQANFSIKLLHTLQRKGAVGNLSNVFSMIEKRGRKMKAKNSKLDVAHYGVYGKS
jgi:hypothetical protein